MKTPTNLELVLSIAQMEAIVEQMRANQRKNPALSNEVRVLLAYDTDVRAHVINADAPGVQWGGKQTCTGKSINLTQK